MQEQQSVQEAAPAAETHLARDIALYTLARLALLLAVTAVITACGVPLLVAAAVSVVVVMPVSMLVFGGLRRRVATGMALRSRQRAARREELRAQLRGDRDEPADHQH